MSAESDLIDRFYTAFQHRDWAAMAACYHAEVEFSDPVFTHLQGRQPAAMWHMLLESASELSVSFSAVEGADGRGGANWVAVYPFSQTGRLVQNRIQASFEFRDGLIWRHCDQFDLWAWTRMALGPMGLLLGWTPFLRNKVRKMAAYRLSRFIDKHTEYR
ncbi:nuclear transport factor 2 family protein [Chitinimonas sp. BJB300]|uniref:nuclear transport factor 2 family protein n=1 Tax=Chitinimonas sp. BJB300 TaxID=1559339 RepID=UPI000C0D5E12|nr:nuclear transport factor 2 family protein [Chitinimonas sp. BJB300]PHV10288.1 ketosteroid isomerase [Chitinimonas sp. BJB300]TSJ91537.1 nuclear transport factor 2 family protein [Chitinimonas sp. BJB300]